MDKIIANTAKAVSIKTDNVTPEHTVVALIEKRMLEELELSANATTVKKITKI